MSGARVLIGMGESGTIPSINAMLVRWFPRHEYSRVAGFCWGGGFAGAILAFPLASATASLWGWRAIFSLFAALGLLWLPFWLFAVSDRPAGPVRRDRKGRRSRSRSEFQESISSSGGLGLVRLAFLVKLVRVCAGVVAADVPADAPRIFPVADGLRIVASISGRVYWHEPVGKPD